MSIKRSGARATIRDVAEKAEVSKGLVSLAFKDASRVSPARRERIFKAADDLGYQPNFLARSLATERSSFIGVLLGNMYNPLFPEIADAARRVFEDAGWHSLITSAAAPGANKLSEVDTHLISMFRDLRPSGVLVVGTLADGKVLPPGTPVAFASGVPPHGSQGAVVRVDDHSGIALAMDHLLSQGRRRLAFVGGEGGAVSQRRLAAYRDVTEARGLVPEIFSAGLTEESGRKATQKALNEGYRPDAVVAVNDLAAIGVQSAADQAGIRVPDEMAIVGFDNTFLSALQRISLSSVDPRNAQVGAQSAHALLAAMSGDEASREELVSPELVVRGSSARSQV